ncbi:MAG: contact-dependent growth inhibition system immunity protein [Terriglobia bacterium]
MRRHDSRSKENKSPHELQALIQFLSAYLHQDFREEYGSAAKAAEAFIRDASDVEARAVRQEWTAWRAQLGHSSIDQIQRSLRTLGAAWQPQNLEDLDRVGEVLKGKSQ